MPQIPNFSPRLTIYIYIYIIFFIHCQKQIEKPIKRLFPMLQVNPPRMDSEKSIWELGHGGEEAGHRFLFISCRIPEIWRAPE